MRRTKVGAGLGATALFLGASLIAQAQSWTFTGSMASRRADHTATLLNNGNVLVAAGEYKGHYGLNTAEVYNPSTGTFSPTGMVKTGRINHTATLLNNGEVLIVGCEFNQYSITGSHMVCLSSAELYNPNTGTFSFTGSMQATRCAGFTATLLDDGTVLIVGGSTTGAELYNPSTRTFSSTGNLSVARSYHTATLLPSGQVLIAGGIGSSNDLNSAELYKPASGTFTLTGSLKMGRAMFTSTLLPNGEVLAAGGSSPTGTRFSSAELFDPSTGKWSSTGSLNYGRFGHTATLLPDGRVLIAAGNIATASELLRRVYPPELRMPRRYCSLTAQC